MKGNTCTIIIVLCTHFLSCFLLFYNISHVDNFVCNIIFNISGQEEVIEIT
jgi:hypothetical protein